MSIFAIGPFWLNDLVYFENKCCNFYVNERTSRYARCKMGTSKYKKKTSCLFAIFLNIFFKDRTHTHGPLYVTNLMRFCRSIVLRCCEPLSWTRSRSSGQQASTWLRGADSPDHEIVRRVEEGRSPEKRYRFERPGGTHPFYPAQSFAIHRGSAYKRTNLWAGYPRHGWFSGFSEGFEGHDAAGKLFYINRGLTGGVHWTRRFRRKKKNYPHATLRESVNRNLLPLHGRFADV